MTTLDVPTYADVLRMARRLLPTEQQRLAETLRFQPTPPDVSTEPDIYALLGDLVIPHDQVVAMTEASLRKMLHLRADEPIPYETFPTIEEVQQATSGIPYDEKLSSEIIAMREEE